MNERVHKQAADKHLEIAEDLNRQMIETKDEDLRVSLRTVAAQNYFYAAINFIESIFARKNEHSFNHENRFRKLFENSALFSKDIIELYQLVDRDLRNKVAYRGENGEKYAAIKKLAELLNKQNE